VRAAILADSDLVGPALLSPPLQSRAATRLHGEGGIFLPPAASAHPRYPPRQGPPLRSRLASPPLRAALVQPRRQSPETEPRNFVGLDFRRSNSFP